MFDWNHDGDIGPDDTFMDYMIYQEVMGESKQEQEQEKKKEGCYIATCVYGSYDCPEVLILRQFRDERLKQNAAGRQFIRFYYAVSPVIVRWFGEMSWFHHFWRTVLDPIVDRLRIINNHEQGGLIL